MEGEGEQEQVQITTGNKTKQNHNYQATPLFKLQSYLGCGDRTETWNESRHWDFNSG